MDCYDNRLPSSPRLNTLQITSIDTLYGSYTDLSFTTGETHHIIVVFGIELGTR